MDQAHWAARDVKLSRRAELGWVGCFRSVSGALSAFAFLLLVYFHEYRSSRDRLRRALYSTSSAIDDLMRGRERLQTELYLTSAAGDLMSGRERLQSEWGRLQTELYSTSSAAGGLVPEWDRLQRERKVLTAAILAAAVFGIADGLVLRGVVGPGWPVPANVSTEFLVLGTGALIGLFLKAYDSSFGPAVYMWPAAIGLIACLVVLKAWPGGEPLARALSPVPGVSAPGEIVPAGGSAASDGLGAWQVAGTMIGAAGTFMLGCAAVFRRRAGG